MQQMGARISQPDDIHDNGTERSFARRNSSCDLVLMDDACFPSEIHFQLSETCSNEVMRV